MIHPMLGLALRLKARDLPAKDGDRIRAVLRGFRRHEAIDAVSELAIETQSLAWLVAVTSSAASATAHDGHILQMLLDFLSAHWADILALFLKFI